MNAVVVERGEGDSLWVLGEHVTTKLDASQTGGTFSVAEITVPQNGGPPPHRHGREDEMFFVLEGSFSFLLNGKTYLGTPGSCVYLPKGSVHTFKNVGQTDGRFLAFVAPAGFEKFFAQIGSPTRPVPGPPDPAVIQRLMEASASFGLDMNPVIAGPPTDAGACPTGRCCNALGMAVAIQLSAAETGGRFTVAEITTPPGVGPPPHVHRVQDELFYVLEGAHEFLLGNDTRSAGPGTFVYVPHGTRHTFRNAGDSPSRLLDIHTPGGFEAFFDEASKFVPTGPDSVAALLDRHGMDLA